MMIVGISAVVFALNQIYIYIYIFFFFLLFLIKLIYLSLCVRRFVAYLWVILLICNLFNYFRPEEELRR